MAVDYVKTPWPWFGGKSAAAPAVWAALGDVDHYESLAADGWRAIEWYRRGFLTGGMANTSATKGASQQHRERLWISPHCLDPAAEPVEPGLTKRRRRG